jgi:molybdopterin converting factor small subunit
MDSAGPPSRQRVSVDEAARALGLTVDAVRKRVQRGTIEHEKDQAGRVRIILDSPDNTSTLQDDGPDTTGQPEAVLEAKDETIEALRERVQSLERQLDARQEEIRRRDILLANLVERVPQLEAPSSSSERRESHENPGPTEDPTPAPGDAQEAAQSAHSATLRPQGNEARGRSWWRRIVGR